MKILNSDHHAKAKLIIVVNSTHDAAYLFYRQMLAISECAEIQNMCIHIASKDLCPASEIDFSISNVIVGTPKDIVQYIENKNILSWESFNSP